MWGGRRSAPLTLPPIAACLFLPSRTAAAAAAAAAAAWPRLPASLAAVAAAAWLACPEILPQEIKNTHGRHECHTFTNIDIIISYRSTSYCSFHCSQYEMLLSTWVYLVLVRTRLLLYLLPGLLFFYHRVLCSNI